MQALGIKKVVQLFDVGPKETSKNYLDTIDYGVLVDVDKL
tara:strand:+ start:3668 stop:3787 length:120 start_codon:yes stop_codon:yes gene_type:complete